MTFDPMCPRGVTSVRISGISYQGNQLDVSFCEDCVTLETRARAGPWAPPLEAELWPSQARLPLPPGKQRPQTHPVGRGSDPQGLLLFAGLKVSFPRSAGRIQRSLP